MPFTDQNKKYLDQYFKEASAKYIENLKIQQKKIEKNDLAQALSIEQEINSLAIWNKIQAAVFAYCEASQTAEDMSKAAENALELAKAQQSKEKSIIDFAEQVKDLINVCKLSFTDPNKDYFFWGDNVGEEKAYTDGLPNKANVIAAQTNDIFKILLGPIAFDPTKKDYTFSPEDQNSSKYVLQKLLYKKSNANLSDNNLPDCSSLLWSVMSKVFADSALQAVEKAFDANKLSPNFVVYLPNQINRDGNFWQWELPAIQQLAQERKVKITYKKIDITKNTWVETSLDDYSLYRKGEAQEKQFQGYSYYEQDKAITVKKLREFINKWRKYTGDKDRERDISVLLNVLHGKTKTDKASKAYQDAGKKTQEDEKNNKDLESSLGGIFNDVLEFWKVRHVFLDHYYKNLDEYYKHNSLSGRHYTKLSKYTQKEQDAYTAAFCYGRGVLDITKIPQTLSGQLRLMQIAKKYHQHQFIIDLFNNDQLKKLAHIKQAQEIFLWAMNRRIENTLAVLPKESVKKDFETSEHMEEEIEKTSKNNSSLFFERTRRLGLLALFDTERKKEHLSNMLNCCRDNFFKYHDPASGAKYLQEAEPQTPDEIAEYKKVAERAWCLIDIFGIDECTECSLLRTAFLAALVLNDKEKLKIIKERMMQVEIPGSELEFVYGMKIYQINNTSGAMSKINLQKNQDFIDIYTAQTDKKWQKLQTESSKDKDVNKQFWRRSYDYRQSLNHYDEGYLRGGNIRYGGVLPQQLVSKGDIEIFHFLLATKIANLVPSKEYLKNIMSNLGQTNSVAKSFFKEAIDLLYGEPNGLALSDKTLQSFDSPNEMLKTVRYIVGLNFQAVADSYDPDKAMYRQLDYTMSAMNRLMGDKRHYKKDHYDSATSLSIMYALRVGDCRHHAESMQLFFDTWKRSKLLKALESNEQDKIQSLNKAQLRVIDTLEEAAEDRTKKKDFIYAHTFNVLRSTDDQNQYQYTVFDAFALNQDPEKLKFNLKDNDIFFDTKRKVNGVFEQTKLKFAKYSGDKGAVKPTNNLSLLGRSGIEVTSVLHAITDKNIGEKLQKTATELADIEKQRRREEMSIDELFDMYVVKGYVFDDKLTMPEINDSFLLAGVMQFLRQQDYPKNTETVKPDRIYKFMAEIKQHRTDLYKQLTRQYDKLMNSIESLQLENNALKEIFEDIKKDVKELIQDSGTLPSKDIAKKLKNFHAKLYEHHVNPMVAKHREIYKPILANVLVILTGVGVLAILAKVIFELKRSITTKSRFSVNKAFFFSNTELQNKIETIDKTVDEIYPNHFHR